MSDVDVIGVDNPEPGRLIVVVEPREQRPGGEVQGADGADAPDNRFVAMVTTGANASHTVSQSLAFAYLALEHARPGTELQVRVVGDLEPDRILSEPIYDPSSARLRLQPTIPSEVT